MTIMISLGMTIVFVEVIKTAKKFVFDSHGFSAVILERSTSSSAMAERPREACFDFVNVHT